LILSILTACVLSQFLECRDVECVLTENQECTNVNNLNRFCGTGLECVTYNRTRKECYRNSIRGQECSSSSDCVGDKMTCNVDNSSPIQKFGEKRCGRPGIPGDSCMASYDCVEGTGVCHNGRCQGVPDGQPCTGWGSNEQCNPGSFCFSPNEITVGLCTPQVPLGDVCHLKDDGTANCQAGLVCDATIIPFTFATGTCKLAYTLPVGSPTTDNDLCRSGFAVAGVCVDFPLQAYSLVGTECADDTDCTDASACVCSLGLANNTQRCQLRNEYFLLQPGLEKFYSALVIAIGSRKCHFSLEPDARNCFMREFPVLANRYYCGLWLSNFQATQRYICDTTIIDWCSINAPYILTSDPFTTLVSAIQADPPSTSGADAAGVGCLTSLFFVVLLVLFQ